MFPTPPGPLLIDRPIEAAMVNFWPLDTRAGERENALWAYFSARFNLRLSDTPEVLFYSRFRKGRHLQRRYDCLKVFYSGENDRPRPGQADLSLTFDPESPANARLPYWRLRPLALERMAAPVDLDAEIASKTGFCNFVYSNRKAKSRIDFFHRLSRYKQVDSGGRVLNNIGGPVDDKLAFLARYKFTIAFENESYPYYTTEKMTEALGARTVPIYWGNPEVARDFNPEAFINARDFKSLDALADYVAQVDRDDALYRRYLSAAATAPFTGGWAAVEAMDNRVFAAFKTLIENPPKQRVAQRFGNRVVRAASGLWHGTKAVPEGDSHE